MPPTQVGGPMGAPGGVYTPNKAGGEYEFVSEHEKTFSGAGGWMVFVGVMFVIFGALGVLGTVVSYSGMSRSPLTENQATQVLIAGGLASLLFVVIGALTLSAGSGFRRVAHTSGNDIANLMQAMIALKRLFFLAAILIILYIVTVIVLVSVAVSSADRYQRSYNPSTTTSF